MNLINASGAPLTGGVVAMVKKILATPAARPSTKTSAFTIDRTQDVYVITVKFGRTSSEDRVIISNANTFRIIGAAERTIVWAGGVPPFAVSVQTGEAAGSFANVDQSIYTLSEREFSVLTEHEKELVDLDEDWWAADDALVNGEATQNSVGVIVVDDLGRQLFAPFGGIQGIYEHFGPLTWCIPIIGWAPTGGTYGAVTVPEAHVYVPGTDSTPLPGDYDYSVNPGTVLNAGVHTLSVFFQATDTVHYRLAAAERTIAVNKATQTITGFAIEGGDGYFTDVYTIVAYASSGLPVTFTCNVVGVVIENGTITFPEPGTYTVYANQLGDSNWEMAPQRTIVGEVTSHMPNANFNGSRADNYLGTTTTYTDTTPAHPDGAEITITWALTRPAGSSASLSHVGPMPQGSSTYLTPDVPGAYTVTLTATDEWGVSTTATNTFTVSAAVAQTVAFSLSPASLKVGQTAAITITNPGTGTGAVTFASSNTAIATVSGMTVTAVAVGNFSITMTKAADAGHLQATYVVSTFAAAPLSYTVVDVNTIQVSGGMPAYTFAVYPTGATGGLTFTAGGGGIINVTGSGCYCTGASLQITDSEGTVVFAPFGTGGFLTGHPLCTSGCPAGTGGGVWGDPVWVSDRSETNSAYLTELSYAWHWHHEVKGPWYGSPQSNCYGPYSESTYPPAANYPVEVWTLYPQEAVSQDGNYKIVFAYWDGSITLDQVPGYSLAELNAATGHNFTTATFGLCSPYAYLYLRIKKLYAK